MSFIARAGIANLLLGAAIVYLSANALTGRQGLGAYIELQAEESALEQERAVLAAEKAVLEARAARLRSASVDLDYLDERARVLLGAAGPNEQVFRLDAR